MPEHEMHPLGLPEPGTAPSFEPSAAGADSALARARHRRTSRGLSAALVALAVPVAAVLLLPSDTRDDSLRLARTPTSAPTPSAAPPAQADPADPATRLASSDAGAAVATRAPAAPRTPAAAAGATQVAPGAGIAVGPSRSPDGSPGSGGTPDSRAGVDDRAKTLRLLLHAPGSGGGPGDPYTSGTAKYWENRTVKGYRVIVEVFGGPQAGTGAPCDAKAKEGFLVAAAPQLSADQVRACAGSEVLVRGNAPYLSTGVTKRGLGGLKNYFATSLTYPDQAERVIRMADAGGYLETGNRKGWAVVISDTPSFLDAEQAIVASLQRAGEKVTVIRTPSSGADAGTVASQLREGQFESVYFLGQPLFFVELTGRVGCPAYCPQWAGVGVSMGTNSIGSQACNVTGRSYKGEFLSPYPGLDRAAELAPGVSFKDDIEFGVYGSMQILDQMLASVPGPSFTREGFIGAVDGRTFPGGIFPKAAFGTSRFGGTRAHALRMDCSKGQHATTGLF